MTRKAAVLTRAGFMLAAAGLLAAGAPANAGLWPEQIGAYKRTAAKPVVPAEAAVFNEFGFKEAEQAEYSGPARISAAAWRFADTTGAFAAWQWLRPDGAVRIQLGESAARAGGSTLVQQSNYVFRFEGTVPDAGLFQAVTAAVPKMSGGPLPNIEQFLPKGGRIAGSEKYALGPQGLAKIEPQVPANVAGFDFGTEVQTVAYRLPAGPVRLSVFSYPNPQIALKQLPEFEKLAGAMAKRTGSLVAVLFSPPNADQAEQLLARVRYNAEVTWSEKAPSARDNVGDLLLNIFMLTGILICLFVAAGIVVGVLRRWVTFGKQEAPMITLHIED